MHRISKKLILLIKRSLEFDTVDMKSGSNHKAKSQYLKIVFNLTNNSAKYYNVECNFS